MQQQSTSYLITWTRGGNGEALTLYSRESAELFKRALRAIGAKHIRSARVKD